MRRNGGDARRNTSGSLQPAIRVNQSMPLLLAGRTSLRTVVASLGLTNFQLLQVLMAVVFLLHAADGAMLPVVFKALEEALHGATPVSLGGIVFAEALCHSLAVVVWGVLADRWCKLALLMYATLSWGLVTGATAFVSSITSLFVVRALAGIIGAAIGPLSQGLIGAVCVSAERGQAFGCLIACGQAGYMLGILLAGSTSHLAAIHGWRGSFLLFALLTLLLSWVLWMARLEVSRGLFQESRTWAQLAAAKKRSGQSGSQLHDLCQDFAFMLQRRSFWVLILQGAFASTTVKAMQYQTMWYQYLGFTDLMASTISCAAPLGCMVGAIISGCMSDWIASRYPRHGRITFGQVTDFTKLLILLYTFVVCGTPRQPDSGAEIAKRIALSFLFGFFSIMAYTAVVKPLFAEIVPAQMIAQVIALAAAIDGAFASIASTPVVGFITQNIFHYQSSKLPIVTMPEAMRAGNAQALGKSIAAVTICSTLLTLLSFSLLHWTYPQDSRTSRHIEADSLPLVEDGEEESCGSADEDGQAVMKPLVKRVSFNLGHGGPGGPNSGSIAKLGNSAASSSYSPV